MYALGGGGILVPDGITSSGITVRNNILSASALDNIYAISGTTVSNNLFNGGSTNGTNAVTGNPLFVNVASANFHIQAASPAINKGILTGAPLLDFDGVMRTGNPDIGAFEHDATTSQNEIRNVKNNFSIYPNPVNTSFVLKILPETTLKNAELKIYDVCGKEVKSIFINNNETIISRDELQTGIYFYQLTDSNKKLTNGKIVVQ